MLELDAEALQRSERRGGIRHLMNARERGRRQAAQDELTEFEVPAARDRPRVDSRGPGTTARAPISSMALHTDAGISALPSTAGRPRAQDAGLLAADRLERIA